MKIYEKLFCVSGASTHMQTWKKKHPCCFECTTSKYNYKPENEYNMGALMMTTYHAPIFSFKIRLFPTLNHGNMYVCKNITQVGNTGKSA